MATLDDAVGVLKDIGFYDVVFPFILILAVVYGLLKKLDWFKSEAVNVVIATMVAMVFISATKAIEFLRNLLPVITGVVVVILLVMIIFMFMGVPQSVITETLQTPMGGGVILIVVLIIVFAALGSTYSGSLTSINEGDSGTTGSNATGGGQVGGLGKTTIKTLFNPVIMALIIMTLVLSIATYFITRVPAKK